MTEYRYQFSRSIPAGRVVLYARNDGTVYHELAVFEISKDDLPLDVQLHSNERRVRPVFATVTVAAGTESRFAVELNPGRRYGFMCFLQAPDGKTNAFKGMNFEART